MFKEFVRCFRTAMYRKMWRESNLHNLTTCDCYSSFDRIKVGNNTYGNINIGVGNDSDELIIGSFCSIAADVVFQFGEHPYDMLSTYPFKALLFKDGVDAINKGQIVVGDDVWIGRGATILSGVTIGQGAIIGAESLVTNDVPPYSIMGGVPAKIIKYRFNQETVELLNKLDYDKLDVAILRENRSLLYSQVEDHIEELKVFVSKYSKE